jgi:hypothetical protein
MHGSGDDKGGETQRFSAFARKIDFLPKNNDKPPSQEPFRE